ncbi:MAG: hypothetical protein H6821_00040 [Planctomycetaceae bacterium]|nr:hypothetical protein [Planctomycetaceae bacterium]MCP5547623.1 hypothetical protein [Akkermansiaceae bacterium]
MATIEIIAQPSVRTTLQAIDGILQTPALESIDVAAAYITTSGVRELLRIMNQRGCAGSNTVGKRWITSFDYFRTEPVALKALTSLPSSVVRIHGATACLERRGTPKVPFHPKAFLFRTGQSDHLVAGSGNISRSGLRGGFEAGLVIGTTRNVTGDGCTARAPIEAFRGYFDSIWNRAERLTPALLSRYEALFESAEHLKNPVPTEDDVAPGENTRGTLSIEDLKKLRVCRHFWIEAGNITRNRGRNLPGNQLMMKRLSRVFFGFEPNDLPRNSPIGSVKIRFGTRGRSDCSLTFSDNGMDKLVLPIPGEGGPPAYDGAVLKFERIDTDTFSLSLGTPPQVREWRTRSGRIGAAFAMSGGRRWGTF